MSSIIPSPGSPGVSPNVPSTIELGSDYTVGAETTLYATALHTLFQTAGLQIPYFDLVNDGTIWIVGGAHASLVDSYNFGHITNNGLAVAEATAGTTWAFRVGSAFGGLTNSGEIFALATGGSAFGVADWAGYGREILNSGLIAARSDHAAYGVFRSNGGHVGNSAGGSILAEGKDAVAVYLGRGHLTPPGWAEVPDIDNAGLIRAVSTDPETASVAIYVDSLAHETMTIVNSGTISGDYAIIGSGRAFSPAQHSIETIVNEAGGVIEGDIFLDMGDDVIVNRGYIAGYVDLSLGDDLFDNSLGQLVGTANLDWGDDRFIGGDHADAVMGERGNDDLRGDGGNDLLLGGRGDDLLIGGAGNDGLYGEAGNDHIVTAGSDRVLAGAGNDRVELGDYTFERIDGGEGHDVLILSDTAKLLDLAAALASGRLAGFEEISLRGGQGIVIRPDDVAQLSGGGSELRVSSIAAGKVDLVGDWIAGALRTIDGIDYRSYAAGPAQVLVQSGAAVSITASAPAGATGLDPLVGDVAAPAPGSVPGAHLTGSLTVANRYDLTASLIIDEDEFWRSDEGAPVLTGNDPFASLVNHGTIASQGAADGAIALAIYVLGAIDNHGVIEGSAWGNAEDLSFNLNYLATYGIDIAVQNLPGNVYAINSGGPSAPLRNSGFITASSEASVAAAYNTWGMDLWNEGSIVATSSRFLAVGIYAHNGGPLVNHGTIEVTGELGAYGFRASTHVASVENHGTITVTAGQAGSPAIGISGTSFLTNSGTIIAEIAVQTDGGGLILRNSGRIDGRIEFDVSRSGIAVHTDVVLNDGIINGEVRLGGERDIYFGADGEQHGSVLGQDGSDLLFGTAGPDSLDGGAGDDLIVGGAGADTLTGRAGRDVFVYRAVSDSDAAAFDTITDFTAGFDRLDLSAIGVTSLSLTSTGSYTTLAATTAAGILTIRIHGSIAASDVILANVQSFAGSAGDDLLVATDGGSVLAGGDGADVLAGAAGNDRLDGGAGGDLMWGGAGDDVYVVDDSGDSVHELGGGGIDTVEFTATFGFAGGYSLPENVETLVLVQGTYGTGNALDNVITGSSSNNVLDGGAGADRLVGGLGDDQYAVDSTGDVVIEHAGEGIDIVLASISYSLGDTIENLTLTGDADLSGFGNLLANRILGNAANNILMAGAGADEVRGGAGDDAIFGEAGGDRLYGQHGADHIIGGEGADHIEGGAHGDLLEGGDGNDIILADTAPAWDPIGGNYRPPDPADFEGIDNLIGGAGADDLRGGSGADRFVYVAASDSVAGARDRISSFETGVDKIDLTALGPVAVSWIETPILTSLVTVVTDAGTMSIEVDRRLTQSDFIYSDMGRTFTGTAGDDVLIGTAGNDEIEPGRARNVVDGGAGDDMLVLDGARSSYQVMTVGHRMVLSAASESHLVANVESVRFADGTVGAGALAAGAPVFEPLRYTASYSDLMAAFGADAGRATNHYLASGFAEGRVASFDALRYIASYGDLIRAFGADTAAATEHYLLAGHVEGRDPGLFDPLRYLASYGDLIRAFGVDTTAATEHYLFAGHAEGRDPALFDPLRYLASYGDLIRAFGTDTVAATQHYLLAGHGEGRDPALFDPIAYAATNRDLAVVLGDDAARLTRHYLDYGFHEGRHVGGFDAVGYLLGHPDLGWAGLGADGALRHWLDYGAAEGRYGDAAFGREQPAHEISAGVSVADILDRGGDRDWFQIELAAGEGVAIGLASGDFDPSLSLYDSAGRLIAFDDDGGAGDDAALIFAASTAGLFYIVVTGTGTAGAYTLDVNVVI